MMNDRMVNYKTHTYTSHVVTTADSTDDGRGTAQHQELRITLHNALE